MSALVETSERGTIENLKFADVPNVPSGTRLDLAFFARFSLADDDMKSVRRFLTFIGVSASQPIAFVVVGAYVVTWLVLDRSSFDWQSAATIATWIRTLFIQRAEHRDTLAIHAKLDELPRAQGRARNALTTIGGNSDGMAFVLPVVLPRERHVRRAFRTEYRAASRHAGFAAFARRIPAALSATVR